MFRHKKEGEGGGECHRAVITTQEKLEMGSENNKKQTSKHTRCCHLSEPGENSLKKNAKKLLPKAFCFYAQEPHGGLTAMRC